MPSPQPDQQEAGGHSTQVREVSDALLDETFELLTLLQNRVLNIGMQQQSKNCCRQILFVRDVRVIILKKKKIF